MSTTIEIPGDARQDVGKGASRRLRRAGKFPAIIYGADKDPRPVAIGHTDMLLHLENEAFYSHVLTLRLPDGEEQVVLKDLQRHPAKPAVLHADFQRVDAEHKLTMQVPIHFINEESCPGRKLGGGLIQHHITELEISCLPKDLPEFIEVDLSETQLGEIIHLADVRLPAGVELSGSIPGEQPVVSVTKAGTVRGEDEEGEAEGGEEGAGE